MTDLSESVKKLEDLIVKIKLLESTGKTKWDVPEFAKDYVSDFTPDMISMFIPIIIAESYKNINFFYSLWHKYAWVNESIYFHLRGVFQIINKPMTMKLPIQENWEYQFNKLLHFKYNGKLNSIRNNNISKLERTCDKDTMVLPEIRRRSCYNVKQLKSASKPLQIVLNFPNEKKPFLYKNFDPIMKDRIAMSFIELINYQWKENKKPYFAGTYPIYALECNKGLLQFIPNAKSLMSIQFNCYEFSLYGNVKSKKRLPEAIKNFYTGRDISFMKPKLFNYLQTLPGDKNTIYHNFINSLIGFLMVSILLGIGDRHNENIVLDNQGRIYHIDYGYIFGNFIKQGGKIRDPTKDVPIVFSEDIFYAVLNIYFILPESPKIGLKDPSKFILNWFIDKFMEAYESLNKINLETYHRYILDVIEICSLKDEKWSPYRWIIDHLELKRENIETMFNRALNPTDARYEGMYLWHYNLYGPKKPTCDLHELIYHFIIDSSKQNGKTESHHREFEISLTPDLIMPQAAPVKTAYILTKYGNPEDIYRYLENKNFDGLIEYAQNKLPKNNIPDILNDNLAMAKELFTPNQFKTLFRVSNDTGTKRELTNPELKRIYST